jgi:uncharacterized integral membrane protein (TIGR00698 family)
VQKFERNEHLSLGVYLFFSLACMASGFSSAMALGAGLVLALGFELRPPGWLQKNSKLIMQCAIVLMGFSMDPSQVAKTGQQGVLVTFVTLLSSLALGVMLTRLVGLASKTGLLISAGTGICGGSAIASLSPVINAHSDDIAVAMACVFFLNAVALLTFPSLGHWLQLTPEQFGWFAAIAIHDTSSVVGAAQEFSPESVAIAVTAKLTRALWIIPLIVVTASIIKWKSSRDTSVKSGSVKFPAFIGYFIIAIVIHALVPFPTTWFDGAAAVGKVAMKIAILLTGAQLTRQIVKSVGPRAMAVAVILWVALGGLTLFWIKNLMS